MKISKKALSDFWASEYINEDGLCFFCHNKGRVSKLLETVFCFCPNGRALKKGNEK